MNLIKQLFEKLFCKHKWKTHVKQEYKWTEKKMVPKTELWINPIIEDIEYENCVEVLICEHCGKIKKINY